MEQSSNNQEVRFAPTVLFTYNRLEHARRTIESLLQNKGALSTDLLVFSDGPRTADDVEKVESVRQYIRQVQGFRSVKLYESNYNKGLAESIISGVSEVLQHHESIIVLEDDMETSPCFLAYMNDALDQYRDDQKVISVHGYFYPIKKSLPSYFFLKGAHCWGWGTWRRAWALYERDGNKLLANIKANNLSREFDYDYAYPFTKMLEDQIAGLNDSWAIRWHATAFVHGMLTLYPGRPYVRNIGFDGSGIHSVERDRVYDVVLRKDYAGLPYLPVSEDLDTRKEVSRFFKSVQPTIIERVVNKLKRILG